MQFKSKRAILVLVALLSFGLFGCDIFGPNGGSNQAPVASFTASRTSGEAPLEISFNAFNSHDPDGNIISYEWNFGDGNTGSGETASHTYSTQGVYTATLTVTDDDGASDQDTAAITVEEPTGETLYVDDDLQDYPDADYTSVREAVEAASDGYTIKVYPGTYNESAGVHNQISLIGMNRPVIRGSFIDWTIALFKDNVTVDGFYITGKGDGIRIYSNQNTISNNIVNSNDYSGISLTNHATQNMITNNTANSNNDSGIRIDEGSNLNTLTNNTIKYNNLYGISIWDSSNNVLVRNTAIGNGFKALALSDANQNRIYLNTFSKPVSSNSHNLWKSPGKITYSYQGNSYTNYMGNHHGEYDGDDTDGDGIGDSPITITGPGGESDESDNYPLIEPFENYNISD